LALHKGKRGYLSEGGRGDPKSNAKLKKGRSGGPKERKKKKFFVFKKNLKRTHSSLSLISKRTNRGYKEKKEKEVWKERFFPILWSRRGPTSASEKKRVSVLVSLGKRGQPISLKKNRKKRTTPERGEEGTTPGR